MTQTYWPVLGQPMNNAQFGEWASEFGTPGVAAGVGSGALLPFRTAGGLFVPAGDAVSVLGAFYRNDADVQVTVPQNTSGTSRNDLLVLRHNLAVAPEPRLVYVTGGATAPVPDPVTDVPLATCLVPSSSAVPLTVVDARTYAGLSVVPCRVVADIPTTVRRFGTFAVESTTGRVRRWDGTSWRDLLGREDYVRQRNWVATRSADDLANPGAFGFVVGIFTVQSAPAGDYAITGTAVVTPGASAFITARIVVGATNITGDLPVGATANTLTNITRHGSFTHIGGDLAVSLQARFDSGQGRFHANSRLDVHFLGPRS